MKKTVSINRSRDIFIYILFHTYPGGYIIGDPSEDIVGVFETLELAKRRASKIQLYGGCGGSEGTRIQRYKIRGGDEEG